MKYLILIALTLSTAFAQGPGFSTRGLDHVGITVPKMDEAKKFFSEVFGCVEASTIGPFDMSNSMSNDRKTLEKARASSLLLTMLDCGDGSKIELFEYKNSKGKQTRSDHEDVGAQHIAFYTSDVKKGVEYLKSKGVTIIGEPMTMTSGPTAGETWVHFMAPWGLEMELVESHKGKNYEGKFMKTETIVEKHFKAINELNASKRAKLLPEIYSNSVRFVDPFFEVMGLEGIAGAYDTLHTKFPEHTFKVVGKPEARGESIRAKWELQNKKNEVVHHGEDIMILQNGKIQTFFVFIEK